MKRFSSSDDLYQSLKKIQVDNPLCRYTQERCHSLFPKIDTIHQLKEKHQALVLAHSYIHPDIIYGVADFAGDSYELAKKAKTAKEETIVFCAVRFMAETAKIINPNKLVLDPNPYSRCSLADSITEEDVSSLRDKYPNHTFVCYINTSAAIKALCDVCVTSANAQKIVETIPSDKIYFLPDQFMGENIANEMRKKKIDKEFLYYHGRCHVHEEYEKAQVQMVKAMHPGAFVIAHPECKQEVVAEADMTGSTSQMMEYIKKHASSEQKFLLLTECGIASRLQVEHTQSQFVGSCSLCKYMRSNSMEMIIQTLTSPKTEQIIELEKSLQKNALKSIDAMFTYA